jgi:sulfite reductase (NADPH) flavoprotein alpha-component
MTETMLRALGAGATAAAYAALCLAIHARQRRLRTATAREAAALSADDSNEPPTLVLFASQTGQAETIAWQTARQLRAAGTSVRVMELNALDAATLGSASRALFVASTYGEGDAPDGASVFAERVMGSANTLALPSLRYAVLALGDRQYTNFCGFGRALDAWLHAAGAQRDFDPIEVDNSDPVALAAWQARWGDAVASDEAPAAAFAPWRLTTRVLLNTGSAGAPVFHLGLTPQTGTMPHWAPGDLAQIAVANDPARPRDYSIASLHTDGELHLLVRQEQHPDGTLGTASGLLTSTLTIGDTVALRLRPHRAFRLDGNEARPLILIGNGTGLAGLRAHLRARAAAGRTDNWLVFGERQAAHDFLYREEIEAWQADGVLQRLDMVFSRDQPERFYVQHRLLQSADALRAWLDNGAAIYVCGSLQGMASGVDAALRQIAGDTLWSDLSTSGRYRRDVY